MNPPRASPRPVRIWSTKGTVPGAGGAAPGALAVNERPAGEAFYGVSPIGSEFTWSLPEGVCDSGERAAAGRGQLTLLASRWGCKPRRRVALRSPAAQQRLTRLPPLQPPQNLAVALQNRMSEVLHVDIHPGAKIGRGVLIDHATGVVRIAVIFRCSRPLLCLFVDCPTK